MNNSISKFTNSKYNTYDEYYDALKKIVIKTFNYDEVKILVKDILKYTNEDNNCQNNLVVTKQIDGKWYYLFRNGFDESVYDFSRGDGPYESKDEAYNNGIDHIQLKNVFIHILYRLYHDTFFSPDTFLEYKNKLKIIQLIVCSYNNGLLSHTIILGLLKELKILTYKEYGSYVNEYNLLVEKIANLINDTIYEHITDSNNNLRIYKSKKDESIKHKKKKTGQLHLKGKSQKNLKRDESNKSKKDESIKHKKKKTGQLNIKGKSQKNLKRDESNKPKRNNSKRRRSK